jgi:hypothetical protein
MRTATARKRTMMQSEQIESIVDLAATIASKADDIEEVMVLYTLKSTGEAHSLDNGMTVAQANFLVDKFKYWLFSCMVRGAGKD